MKKILLSVVFLAAVAQADEWYDSKGTLHFSTAAEWRTADYPNKLVTVADVVWDG